MVTTILVTGKSTETAVSHLPIRPPGTASSLQFPMLSKALVLPYFALFCLTLPYFDIVFWNRSSIVLLFTGKQGFGLRNPSPPQIEWITPCGSTSRDLMAFHTTNDSERQRYTVGKLSARAFQWCISDVSVRPHKGRRHF